MFHEGHVVGQEAFAESGEVEADGDVEVVA